jgi:hypothetical protein
MEQYFSIELPRVKYRYRTVLLAIVFSFGVLLGAFSFCYTGLSFLPLMRSCQIAAVSIVCSILLDCLPFLLSAFAISVSASVLFPIVFVRGFIYSFVAAGISTGFGSAGCIIRLFFLFSDTVSMPLLYFFWQRHIRFRDCPVRLWELVIYLFLISLIECVQLRIISPILVDILYY